MVRNVILFFMFVAVVIVSAQRRMINGQKAHIGEFPYVVSVNLFGEHECGGSIISDSFVLTAAHCFGDPLIIDPSSISILYGIANRKTRRSNKDTILGVKKVIIHEDYSPPPESYPHDIALLELQEKIKFGPKVYPVTLTNQDAFPGYNILATLPGWGRTGYGEPFSQDLLKNHLTMVTSNYCENSFVNTTYYPGLQLCGYFHYEGTGSCHGDSGGPLMINGIQVGLVSWGSNKCVIGSPTVFTNVGQYRNWIKMNSGV